MGKTIITHLIDGKAKGAQYASINNRTCKMLSIPRSEIEVINSREELQSPALYILIGEDDKQNPSAYIGETENFKERIKDHNAKKIFWQKALIFISKDGAITKADVQYLEHLAVKIASKAKRFSLNENKQTPKAPNLPEHQKDTMDDFFEDIKFLTSFCGYSVFDVVGDSEKSKHIFYTKSRGIDAKGFYDENGFTVLKGSIIASRVTNSFSGEEKRIQLIKDYATKEGDTIKLHTDLVFSSPSSASSFCLGRSSNGWTDWVDKKNQSLDVVHRNKLEK